MIPPIRPDWNKYERGFLLGFGGSVEFKGAIKLAGRAALSSGAGIVRLFGLEDIGPLPDELIFQTWDKSAWNESLKKAQAVMVGPGMGRKPEARRWLKQLHKIEQPVVIDADALFFLPMLKHWPKHAILTPHRGEMAHLLGGKSDSILERAADFAERKKVVLLLKGAPTHVFVAGEKPVVISEGDPGMATAGSGDVLTGIIGALLAQGMQLKEAAVAGAILHGLAGEAAAKKKTSYCMIASDLIKGLPEAFRNILQTN